MVSAKEKSEIGDIVIVQEEVPRNEWALGKIMDTSTEQQGLVRSVKIKLGSRNPQKKGNDTNSHIIERQVQRWSSYWKAWSKTSSNDNA